jgi:hypothetical protein
LVRVALLPHPVVVKMGIRQQSDHTIQ